MLILTRRAYGRLLEVPRINEAEFVIQTDVEPNESLPELPRRFL